MQQKTAGDLQVWLKDELSRKIAAPTVAFPHGGTALTLLGLKGSTKDVDFSFISSDEFERFVHALKQLDYETTMDIQATRNEHLVRMENSNRRVDVVDLRWPTWNNWMITKTVLTGALQVPFGNLTLVRLDENVIFLFKTYPIRDADLADLRTILDTATLNERRIIALFDEQDSLHRKELLDADTRHEPLLNILELRVRVAGSFELLGAEYRKRVPRLAKHAVENFRDLGLDKSLLDLVGILRSSEGVLSWDDILGREFETLRNRLAVA